MALTARRRAELYRWLHRGLPGDVEHYLSHCPPGTRVLELGVGFGRLALPLARRGARVVGIDCDEGMLELARTARAQETPEVAERIELLAGDMASFRMAASAFDRVLLPFNGLYCLLDDERLDACLRAVVAHLARDGRLLFDVYRADALHRSDETEDDEEELLVTLDDGEERYDVFESNHWSRSRQRLDVHYRFVARHADGEPRDREHLLRVEHRYLLHEQVDAALQRCGLAVLERHGGFRHEPFDPHAEQLVVVAGF